MIDNKLLECPDGRCEMRPQKIVSDQEIVRSFLQERGINVNESAGSTGYLATNKTMVEWMAKHDPKVREFWEGAGALDK